MAKAGIQLQLQLLELLLGASSEGNKEAVLYLLENGGNPFLQSPDINNGESALIAASKNGHADVVAICCFHAEWIAGRNEGLAATDNLGMNCVQWATRMHHVGCLSVILHIQPERFADIERYANSGTLPTSILSSPAFRSFVSMHYPQHLRMLRAPNLSTKKNIPGYDFGHSLAAGPTPFSFDQLVKTWCCSCASWYRLENSMLAYAPYACFTSLLVGFMYSFYFARFSEMWLPGSTMIPLQGVNFGSQFLLWIFVYKANISGAGNVSQSTAYEMILFKVVETARANVVEAAIAADAPAKDQRSHYPAPSSTSSSSSSPCCHICRIWKRSHEGHSPVTHRCIPEYDHYCVYLGHEIGRDNYPMFFYALGTMAIVALPSFIMLAVTFIRHGLVAHPTHSLASQVYYLFFNCFLGWAIMSECQMLAFFLFHCYATSVGLTTREVSKNRKTGTGPLKEKATGILQNWAQRLFPKTSNILFTFRERDRNV